MHKPIIRLQVGTVYSQQLNNIMYISNYFLLLSFSPSTAHDFETLTASTSKTCMLQSVLALKINLKSRCIRVIVQVLFSLWTKTAFIFIASMD